MRMQNLLLACTIAAVVSFSPVVQCEPKKYVNEFFHYELQPPEGWNLSEGESKVPHFYSYPRSEALSKGLYPRRGSNLDVIPMGADPRTSHFTTLREWIDFELRWDYSNVLVREIPDMGVKDGPHGVIEVEADFEMWNGEVEHQLNYFYLLEGRPFLLTLGYWKGDRDGEKFKSICRSVLRSIRSR